MKPIRTQINPYLIFNGNCREAMTFYKDCLDAETIIQTVEDSPMADQWPVNVQKNILHASLVKNDLRLLASDMTGPGGFIKGNAVSLAIQCGSKAEIEAFFKKLSAGGTITHPLYNFFEGTIGALTDKFGINWLFKL